VVISYDHATGSWMFIAIHNTALGNALGGCRMRVYERPEDGLLDAMRLAEGMTYKWAGIGYEYGGGKSVLAVPGVLDPPVREGILRRFGKLVESLGGLYSAGEDLGTTPEDMAIVAEETQWVKGVRGGGARAIDPGPYTALGVHAGIRSALRRVFGTDQIAGRTVLIRAEMLLAGKAVRNQSAGASQEAFEVINGTLEAQEQLLRNRLKNAVIIM